MQAHFFFSVFLDDGSAFGKADIDTPTSVIPQVGDSIDLLKLATKGEAAIFSLPNDPRVTKIQERDGYLGVELTDVVLDSKSAATSFLRVLQAVGFDCDTWA